VEGLLARLGIEARIRPSGSPWLDPGARAIVLAGDRPLGHLGYPSRELLGCYGLRVRPACCELDVQALLELRRPRGMLPALPRFPTVVRDLAFVVDASRPYGELDAAIRSLGLPILVAVAFFDEFRGPQVGAGQRSLALRLVFRSADRTLTSEEVDRAVQAILARASERCGAVLRGA
jgi:phenylalanyl-tRNA synthetase beta chain